MSLSAFLAENAVPVENIKFVASKRFLGEDGNPIPWEIKTITGTEDEALRKSCAKRVPVPGKKNQYQKETDYDLYLGKLAVACTVFPNLNDKELQDSYKVMGADGLEGVIVRHDVKDIHGLGGLPGRILFLATGGGGYRRQTCQNE